MSGSDDTATKPSPGVGATPGRPPMRRPSEARGEFLFFALRSKKFLIASAILLVPGLAWRYSGR